MPDGPWRFLARVCCQWRTKKISEGGTKFRHNRLTLHINFRGSAGSGGMPQGTTKLHLKIRIFVHSGSKF